MAPAGRLGEAPGLIKIAEPGIGIGLEDPGIAGEVPIGQMRDTSNPVRPNFLYSIALSNPVSNR
jgi:hypothetical protein